MTINRTRNRPNDRFSNRAFRFQSSTPPVIEHLSFSPADPSAESTAEVSSPEQAIVEDALSNATVTGTDIVYLSDLQPQPVEWLWQHRLAAGTLAMLSGEPGSGKTSPAPSLRDLEDALQRTQARLVIPNPWDGLLGSQVALDRTSHARPLLDRPARPADVHRCCILLIRHLRKPTAGRPVRRGPVRSSKDGKSGAWWWALPSPAEQYPAVNQAR